MAELTTIARPYAEALFQSAVQDGNKKLNEWRQLLAQFAQIAANEDVNTALTDPNIEDDVLVSIFTDLVKVDLDQQAKNFITLLVENDRILLLPHIAQQFDLLYHKQQGTAGVEIVSAFKLTKDQTKQLVTLLEKKFNLKLEPTVIVDPDLIGGVRCTVGDQVLDTSVQAQLTGMRDTLVA